MVFKGSITNLFANLKNGDEYIRVCIKAEQEYKITSKGVFKKLKITRHSNAVFKNLSHDTECHIDGKNYTIPDMVHGKLQCLFKYKGRYHVHFRTPGVGKVAKFIVKSDPNAPLSGDPTVLIVTDAIVKRREKYPSITDQVIALYDMIGKDNLTGDALKLYNKVQDVKKKYPKDK